MRRTGAAALDVAGPLWSDRSRAAVAVPCREQAVGGRAVHAGRTAGQRRQLGVVGRRTGLEERFGQVRRCRLGSRCCRTDPPGSTGPRGAQWVAAAVVGAASTSVGAPAGSAGASAANGSAPIGRGRRTGSSSGPRAGSPASEASGAGRPERGGSAGGGRLRGGGSATESASASEVVLGHQGGERVVERGPDGHGVGQGLGDRRAVAVGGSAVSSAHRPVARSVSSTIVDGSETMAVTPPAGDGISRTVTPMRAGQPADDDEAERAGHGQADERRVGQQLVGVGQLVGVMPMPWSVTETT